MQASRVRRGFHRLGLVLAALLIVAFATDAVRIVINDGHVSSATLQMAMVVVIYAGALYAACWGLGWVISGFMRDEG